MPLLLFPIKLYFCVTQKAFFFSFLKKAFLKQVVTVGGMVAYLVFVFFVEFFCTVVIKIFIFSNMTIFVIVYNCAKEATNS